MSSRVTRHVQYVGRTIRRLKDRLCDHLYDIEKDHNTNVARHWNLTHSKDTFSLHIQGIEKIICPVRGGDKFRLLCRREVFWIFFLNTRIPRGVELPMGCFLLLWLVQHYAIVVYLCSIHNCFTFFHSFTYLTGCLNFCATSVLSGLTPSSRRLSDFFPFLSLFSITII